MSSADRFCNSIITVQTPPPPPEPPPATHPRFRHRHITTTIRPAIDVTTATSPAIPSCIYVYVLNITPPPLTSTTMLIFSHSFVLSHILDPAVKYKKFTFLECESVLITSMVYKGAHVLVIESKETSGCRILLNRRDLMTLQYLEWIIFETVSRKINIVRPNNILNQLEQISEYFKTDFNIDKSATLDEVISIIRGIHIELITKHIPKNKQSFLTQIILFATEQLAINWMTKSKNSLKTVDTPSEFISPTKRKKMHDVEELKFYTEIFDVEMLQPSLLRYSSMSPLLRYNEDDPSQSRGADEEKGLREYLTAWAPIQKTKPRPIHAVDENDGPTYFNRQPSSPPSLSDFIDGNNVYIHIGLNPELLFNYVVCITSNSQCVKMSVELFQSLNTLLNTANFRLLSHLLLKEFKLMSIEEFNRVNILLIKCLQQDQNVQLTKENVKKILQLSDAMREVIQMKNIYARSASLLQACKISIFLEKEMPLPKDTKISDVEDYLEYIEAKKLKERISVQGTCLIADLKIKELKQLARGWLKSTDRGQEHFGIQPANLLFNMKCLFSLASICTSQAAFCRLFNLLGVCEQKPLKLEDIPGDFNFCISTPLISYRISENKNAKPLFVKLNSPFSTVISADSSCKAKCKRPYFE
ncbi:hypothetical protein AGLY_014561 [Aphis glycines]|uniref:Uncharacterized protein n=1 Tax=Aphis glycines TaxID=307491 RepID=A0A6G0T5H4_APHGL|nr:hypothetical protein AGLY_014561 [Aphis glycines]